MAKVKKKKTLTLYIKGRVISVYMKLKNYHDKIKQKDIKNLLENMRYILRDYFLPEGDYAVYNGIKVPEEVQPKKNFSFLPPSLSPNNPNYKEKYIPLLKERISSDDQVTIIGGGRGVSSVIAAQKLSGSGKLTIYEGSPKMASIIEKTLKLNDIKEGYKIINKIVGPGIDVYSDEKKFDRLHPEDLEPCDILFMDCEGAELKILQELKIKPKYIISELHPYKYVSSEKFEVKPEDFLEELRKLNYKIKNCRYSYGKSEKFKEVSSYNKIVKLLYLKYSSTRGNYEGKSQNVVGIGLAVVGQKEEKDA